MRVLANTKAQRLFLATATISSSSRCCHLALFSSAAAAFTPTTISFLGNDRHRSRGGIVLPLSTSAIMSSSSTTTSQRFLSSGGAGGSESQQPQAASATANIKHINKEQMKQILQEYEGDNVDNYCVIDVRTDPEVLSTGKLSPRVHTLPVQVILQTQAFAMSDDDFEDAFGFSKPNMDTCIVFTCAAGIRSVYACQAAAAQAGYSNLINYAGGANEWFS